MKNSAKLPRRGLTKQPISLESAGRNARRRLPSKRRRQEPESLIRAIAHDLRSPLLNIQGFGDELARLCRELDTQVARRGNAGDAGAEWWRRRADEIGEAVGFIQASVAKMDSLLEGLHRYVRLDRAVLSAGRIHMKALTDGIVRAMSFQIRQAGAQLRVGPLPDCLGDPAQVGQVFSNLLDNAVKYLDPARVGRIYVTGSVRNGLSLSAVRDNGIGIAPKHQSKIFEMFHRVDPARGDGEGIGLALAQRILERLEGRIAVRSRPGSGATFFVYLPAPSQAK